MEDNQKDIKSIKRGKDLQAGRWAIGKNSLEVDFSFFLCWHESCNMQNSYQTIHANKKHNGIDIAIYNFHSNYIHANIMPYSGSGIKFPSQEFSKHGCKDNTKGNTMSDKVMADIALALAKGIDLVHRCGDEYSNDVQRMLVCEAIQSRVNKDLRPIMKRHGEAIKKAIPITYEQYADGLISQAECLSSYLLFLSGSDYQNEKDTAQALHASLWMLEDNLRKIHCPESYWGKGCLISG